MDIIVIAVIGFVIVVAGVVIAPTVKMAMGLAPFLYTNTRCSARSGLILSRKHYEGLVGSTSMQELFAALEETAYAHLVEHAQDYATASKLLEEDLASSYVWLATVVPEKLQPIVEEMAGRFEVHDLKEALNRLKRGEPAGELPHVREEQLRLKLEGAQDYTSFTDALEGSVYEEVFRGRELGELGTLNALDALHVRRVMAAIEACKDEKAAAPFKEYWRRVIDIANVRQALRRIEGAEASFIGGGLIEAKEFLDVADAAQLNDMLEKHGYATDDVELALQRSLRKESGLVNAKHPLKGGSIVRYLIDKELEVRNLNIVLKLKEEGFDGDSITKLVV